MFGVPARKQTGDVATQEEATSSSRMSMIASAGDQHRCDTVNHADTTRHHCTRDFMNWGVGDIAIPCSYGHFPKKHLLQRHPHPGRSEFDLQ